MESKEIVSVIFLIAGGIFTITASVLNWEFFFGDPKAKMFGKLFGREGSRVIYILIGVFLILVGFFRIVI